MQTESVKQSGDSGYRLLEAAVWLLASGHDGSGRRDERRGMHVDGRRPLRQAGQQPVLLAPRPRAEEEGAVPGGRDRALGAGGRQRRGARFRAVEREGERVDSVVVGPRHGAVGGKRRQVELIRADYP